MDDDTRPKIIVSKPEHVDASEVRVLDLDELAARRVNPGNGVHHWAIPVLFTLTDPEAALDDMELSGDNLMGFGAISCVWCRQDYTKKLAARTCMGPQGN